MKHVKNTVILFLVISQIPFNLIVLKYISIDRKDRHRTTTYFENIVAKSIWIPGPKNCEIEKDSDGKMVYYQDLNGNQIGEDPATNCYEHFIHLGFDKPMGVNVNIEKTSNDQLGTKEFIKSAGIYYNSILYDHYPNIFLGNEKRGGHISLGFERYNTPNISLVDSQGVVRMKYSLGANGAPGLSLFDSGSFLRLSTRLNPNDIPLIQMRLNTREEKIISTGDKNSSPQIIEE